MKIPWFTDKQRRGHDPQRGLYERLGRGDLLSKVVPKTRGVSLTQFRRRRARNKVAKASRKRNRRAS